MVARKSAWAKRANNNCAKDNCTNLALGTAIPKVKSSDLIGSRVIGHFPQPGVDMQRIAWLLLIVAGIGRGPIGSLLIGSLWAQAEVVRHCTALVHCIIAFCSDKYSNN